MTRVLHVISGLGTGGAESFLATLAPRLAQRGIESTVVSLTGDGAVAERLRAAGIPLRLLDMRGPVRLPMALAALARIVREVEPQVIQGWMYHGDLAATLARTIAAKPRTLLYWNIRCSDMRLDDYSRQLRLVVRACARLSRRPSIVIANSQAGARVHTEAGYRPRQLVVIPNGVDCERFRPDAAARAGIRSELGLAPEACVVALVARVDPMKDHDTAVRAASLLRGATLLLIGAGTEVYTAPPGIIGLGRRDDVPRLLAAADIIASSSAYGEGFSNAIAEGMAAGLVPVVTDVGDARQIVGGSGAVVPPSDAVALAGALQEVINLPANERTRRGAAARALIAGRFSIERAVDRFTMLYTGGA